MPVYVNIMFVLVRTKKRIYSQYSDPHHKKFYIFQFDLATSKWQKNSNRSNITNENICFISLQSQKNKETINLVCILSLTIMKSIITPIHNLYTRSIETQGKCRRELSLSMSITFKIHALAVKYIWPWTTVAFCLINTNFWWRNFKTLKKLHFN